MGSEVEQDAAAPPDGRAGDPVTEPLWRQFVEHTPAAVAMFDREMRYLLYSRRWLEDYGLGDRDITGLSHYEVFPEIPERWKELHRRALAGEVVRCDEDPFPRADGRLDWVRWELQPWRHPDGSIGGIIMFTEVITARKRMEDEVRRSREQYAELFKANPHPMWVYDLETLRFLDVNEAACQNYEYSRDEFLAMMITDILPREDVEHLLRRIEKGRAVTGLDRSGVWRHCKKDGSQILVEITSHRMTFDNRPAKLVLAHDVTELKRAEDALRYIARASHVLASSLDPATTLDNLAHLGVPTLGDWCMIYAVEEGDVLRRAAVAYADPANADLARRLMSFPAPQLERFAPLLECLRTARPQLFDRVPDQVLQALATSPEHLATIRQLRPTSAVTVPIYVRGRLAGIANFFTVSERRYTEAEVALADDLGRRAGQAMENARLYTEAQQANAAKDQFIAMLSHELRNPLAPILAGIEILRRTVPDVQPAQRTLEVIDRNVKLQARLIDDLLDLSRIARGQLDIKPLPVMLDPIVDAALQAQAREIRNANLVLTASVARGLRVMGDPDRLQQVVMNLLANAAKFTPAGGNVWVTLRQENGSARLTVEDNGIGIPPESLSAVFQMFQQGEVAGRRAPGLGIGLALAKQIVELHHGRIWAESKGPGKGSRFIVELPLLPDIPDEHLGDDSRPGEGGRGGVADGGDERPEDGGEELAEDKPEEEGARALISPHPPVA